MNFKPLNYLVESSINRILQIDYDMYDHLMPYEGKVARVEISGLGWIFYFQVGKDSIRVLENYTKEADTIIKGTFLAMMKMGFYRKSPFPEISKDISVEGDMEFGAAIHHLMREIHIDWEEQLSKVIGDIAAHRVGNVVRDVIQWGKKFTSNLQSDFTQYVQEEKYCLPCREEIKDFCSDVESIRDDVARMEMRVSRLFLRMETFS